MNSSRAARSKATITNNTNCFGVMGGLAPQNGINAKALSPSRRRARNQQTLSVNPALGKLQLMERNILSRNPPGSGGVGKTSIIAFRKAEPCQATCKPYGIEDSLWDQVFDSTERPRAV